MTTAVKERPIIFSADMVRAILDGRKTQTRRVVKEEWCDKYGVFLVGKHEHEWTPREMALRCPYGAPGNRLWVRETWGYSAALPTSAHYTRDDSTWCAYPDMRGYKADDPPGNWCWKPSIHMPRWASRITLQVTDVRVERVQDISYQDILSEGMGDPYKAPEQLYPAFAELWDSINAKRGYGWDVNPFVWVLEFERVTP